MEKCCLLTCSLRIARFSLIQQSKTFCQGVSPSTISWILPPTLMLNQENARIDLPTGPPFGSFFSQSRSPLLGYVWVCNKLIKAHQCIMSTWPIKSNSGSWLHVWALGLQLVVLIGEALEPVEVRLVSREKICHWGWALSVHSLTPFSSFLTLVLSWNVISVSCCQVFPAMMASLSLWNYMSDKSFCKLLWPVVLYTSNRTVINTQVLYSHPPIYLKSSLHYT